RQCIHDVKATKEKKKIQRGSLPEKKKSAPRGRCAHRVFGAPAITVHAIGSRCRGAAGGGAMSKDIERQFEEQAKFWSGIASPNAVGRNLARELAAAIQGFERARGQLAFEDEPSGFEAALQETKERTPCRRREGGP